MEYKISGGNSGANIYIDNERENNGIRFFDVNMVLESEAIPEQFCLSFKTPDVDIYSVWSPSIRYDRSICPDWRKQTTTSSLASWLPLHALLSSRGRNRMTVTLSDVKTPISILTGECEEDASIAWDINFFIVPIAALKSYKLTVRIDRRDIPYYDAIRDSVSWLENDCGYQPAPVPEYARLPMNSLWYSYHQQLDVDDIVKECELSKKLGMETVIVDDGWQTEDNSRGYKFCGDWEVAPSKIPDMKQFVDRVHATGMKIMLWFSVPFIGTGAKNFERFRDMILDKTGDEKTFFSLDPRYKEVRRYLVDMYVKAVKKWGFDGLKLDFINAFGLRGKSLEFDPRRDYTSLEDGIDALMSETTAALRKINPDILIEFRQSYIGPAIRKYGNMLRVTDCPNDAIRNRADVVNLRLTSGKTAVHSDMIMWNREDTVESAALEFVSTLYSVPQISVKIATLSDVHKRMLEFYLSFWRKNRDILIDGNLLAANPESLYSIVCAEKDGNAIFTAHTDTLIDCSPYSNVIAINASRHHSLIIKGANEKTYKTLDCMGNVLEEGTVIGLLCEINVPLCGMIQII
ncbi:MAG: alpha-galactosidase [Clostridia bacterium]|nr:alpha-galactosidase [Clostridia bacterium]